jgi:hypothetical protein
VILLWFVGSIALLIVGLCQLIWGLIRMGFYAMLLGLLAIVYAFVLVAALIEEIIHRRRHTTAVPTPDAPMRSRP